MCKASKEPMLHLEANVLARAVSRLLLAVGYPSDEESLTSKVARVFRRRKPLKRIVSLEEYGEAYGKMQT
jgi:hypothetical protein